eukprot:m.312587 g.312587  ORF g.312587 m.312587 type:complete len:204 (-) comp16404_c2_seq16:50-661(-)
MNVAAKLDPNGGKQDNVAFDVKGTHEGVGHAWTDGFLSTRYAYGTACIPALASADYEDAMKCDIPTDEPRQACRAAFQAAIAATAELHRAMTMSRTDEDFAAVLTKGTALFASVQSTMDRLDKKVTAQSAPTSEQVSANLDLLVDALRPRPQVPAARRPTNGTKAKGNRKGQAGKAAKSKAKTAKHATVQHARSSVKTRSATA